MEVLSIEKSAEPASLRATNTRSHPCWTPVRRAVSRSLRFTLFRTTAPPTALLTEKPNRLTFRPLGRARSTRSPLDQLRPSRRTAAKSAERVRLGPFDMVGVGNARLRGSDREPLSSFEHTAA